MIEATLEPLLIRIVEGAAATPAGEILEATRRLDALLEEHRASLHPRLRHFLERRSYRKALDFIRSGGVSGKAHCPPE